MQRRRSLHLFVTRRADLHTALCRARTERGRRRGDLDLVAEEVREGADRHHRRHDPRRGVAARLVDIKVCAVDETWSGLKLVIRKELRAKPAATGRKRTPAKGVRK